MNKEELEKKIGNIEKLKELELKEVLNLPTGSLYYVFNHLTNLYSEQYANPLDIAHNKYVYSGLKYYIKK